MCAIILYSCEKLIFLVKEMQTPQLTLSVGDSFKKMIYKINDSGNSSNSAESRPTEALASIP